MNGFELFNDNRDFRVTNGSRTVLTTEGALINLLPSSFDVSTAFSVAFPDFEKDYLYAFTHLFSASDFAGQVGYDSACITQLTIPEQQFSNETNIMEAPASSNIFVGGIVLSRTKAPSHTWAGSSIDPLHPMGVSIPFVSGSLLVEAEIGMARAFSIYVSGGFLKLHWQQSVSTPPGGFDVYPNRFGNVHLTNQVDVGGGGANYFGTRRGIPVQSVDLQNPPSFTRPNDLFAPSFDGRCLPGGASACATPNYASYNYGSTYQAVLTGSFGRRS